MLSDVHKHFIDKRGIKFFVDYNMVYGELIRQIQMPNGQMFDASDGSAFDDKMRKLGMVSELKSGWMVMWYAYNNMHAGKFICEVFSVFDFVDGVPTNTYTKLDISNGRFTDRAVSTEYKKLFKEPREVK